MLDFKIKELKRQIEPREMEIGNMKDHIKEMDRELQQVGDTSIHPEICDVTLLQP